MAIVSGLAITYMIGSLYELLSEYDKVSFDWLALMAAGVVGYTILYGWWVTWAAFHLRTGPLPFWRFLMPMLSVTALALAARAALPNNVVSDKLDLAKRYDNHSVWIWRSMLASACILMAGALVRRISGEVMGTAATPWGLAGLGITLAWFATLRLTRSRRVHAVLVPAYLLLLVTSTFAQPVQ